jgi:hypothetical protein
MGTTTMVMDDDDHLNSNHNTNSINMGEILIESKRLRMSMKQSVDESKQQQEQPQESSFHLMPCEISYTGPAQVAGYFLPQPLNTDGNSVSKSQSYSGECLMNRLCYNNKDSTRVVWFQKGW